MGDSVEMSQLDRFTAWSVRIFSKLGVNDVNWPIALLIALNVAFAGGLLMKRALQTMHPSEHHFSLLKLSPLNSIRLPRTARAHMDSLRKATTGLRVLAVPTLYPFLDTATFHRLDEIDPSNPPDWIIFPQDPIRNLEKIQTRFMFDFTFDGEIYHVHEVVK